MDKHKRICIITKIPITKFKGLSQDFSFGKVSIKYRHYYKIIVIFIRNVWMKKTFLSLFLFTFALSLFSEEQNDDKFKFLEDKINNLNVRIEEQDRRIRNIDEKYDALSNILNQYMTLNSMVSTYFTILSIVLTIIAIALPFINIFTVILPNKKIRKKIYSIYKNIPNMVNDNFDQYMKNFETKQADKVIDQFVNNDDTKSLSEYLFLNRIQLNEMQYRKIIKKINSEIEIGREEAIIIFSHLIDIKSKECIDFFKSIIENEDENQYLEYAISFIAYWDIKTNIHYLEKVLTNREDFEKVLISLFDEIMDKYIGDPFRGYKSESEKNKGIDKIMILFNNNKIIEAFSKEKASKNHMGIHASFLDNLNTINFNPFLKETGLYKKYYQKT
jgi:hypothetical protein